MNSRRMWARRFHYGIHEIEQAYKASRDTTDKEVAKIEDTAAKYQAMVDNGEAAWLQEDEDGNWVYDYGEDLGEKINDAKQVLALIRNAYVITLHHFVEQQVGAKLPDMKYHQERAFAWFKSFGWAPMEDGLNQLRLAANCAKHSKGTSASELYKLRSDMFDDEMIKGRGASPSYETLKLTDAHVDEFFAAVNASVPNNNTFRF